MRMRKGVEEWYHRPMSGTRAAIGLQMERLLQVEGLVKGWLLSR